MPYTISVRMLVLVICVGSVIFLFGCAYTLWFKPVRRPYSVCLYLHRDAVMDLYQMGQGAVRPALEKSVQQTTRSKIDGSVGLGASNSAGASTEREKVEEWVQEAQPVTVIGIVVDILSRAGWVVDVDLTNMRITRGNALRSAGTPYIAARTPPASRKHWQALSSTADWWVVAAKNDENGREYGYFIVKRSEGFRTVELYEALGLKLLDYGLNEIDAVVPKHRRIDAADKNLTALADVFMGTRAMLAPLAVDSCAASTARRRHSWKTE